MDNFIEIKIQFSTMKNENSKNEFIAEGYVIYVINIEKGEIVDQYIQLKNANYKLGKHLNPNWLNNKKNKEFRSKFLNNEFNSYQEDNKYEKIDSKMLKKINHFFKEEETKTIRTQLSYLYGINTPGAGKYPENTKLKCKEAELNNLNFANVFYDYFKPAEKIQKNIHINDDNRFSLKEFLIHEPYFREKFLRLNINEIKKNDLIWEKINKEINKREYEKNFIETEKWLTTKIRTTQAQYRKSILLIFEKKCILSDIKVEELLIASHIKPWNECNHKERMDKANGLLLAASIDKLFDGHYISIDGNEKLYVSKKFKKKYKNYEDILKTIGIKDEYISRKSKIPLPIQKKEEMKVFLNVHFNLLKNTENEQ
ncbi:MAG: MAG4270 family putative restriction endonuclease [Metamycoplasmataceae bacterium]